MYDHTIPDTSYETMRRYGWGFGEARDHGSTSGLGMFVMCPLHRPYDMLITRGIIDPAQQRANAIERWCKATGKTLAQLQGQDDG